MRNTLFRINYFKSKEYYMADNIRLVHSGNDYFDTLIHIIDFAKETVQFQVYIFDDDVTGKRVLEALIKAAKRGVLVSLLLDGFGSKNISDEVVTELKNSGIDVRFFAPLLSFQSIYLGRRMHHKIVVIDKQKALVGGINIADKYSGAGNKPAWLDYAIYVEGSACEELSDLCFKMYNFKNRLFRIKSHRFFTKKIDHYSSPSDSKCWIQIKQNDRLRGKNQISESYLKAIRSSKNSIYITGSYFLPGRKIRKALLDASKRGVEVNLILAGVSDVPLFKAATSWLYDLLFRHKINIYEWNTSVLHGKVAVIDNNWATVGSFNLNHLSAYGSIELNIDTANDLFVANFKEHLKNVIKAGCEQVLPEKQNNSYSAKLKRWFAYKSTRLAIKLMVIFPYLNPTKRFN